MRLVGIGIGIGIVLVAFVSVWVYMASQGNAPSIGGQLQELSWGVRFGGLVVLAVVLGLLFAFTRRPSS